MTYRPLRLAAYTDPMEEDLKLLRPWKTPHPDASELVLELEREAGPAHPLYSKKVRPLAVATDRDDVLFEICEGTRPRYAVVHLS